MNQISSKNGWGKENLTCSPKTFLNVLPKWLRMQRNGSQISLKENEKTLFHVPELRKVVAQKTIQDELNVSVTGPQTVPLVPDMFPDGYFSFLSRKLYVKIMVVYATIRWMEYAYERATSPSIPASWQKSGLLQVVLRLWAGRLSHLTSIQLIIFGKGQGSCRVREPVKYEVVMAFFEEGWEGHSLWKMQSFGGYAQLFHLTTVIRRSINYSYFILFYYYESVSYWCKMLNTAVINNRWNLYFHTFLLN